MEKLINVIVDTIAATRNELLERIETLEKRLAALDGGDKPYSPAKFIATLEDPPQ